MNGTELILTVIFCGLFVFVAVFGKITRKRPLKTVFSVVSALFGAAVFVMLIYTGASHAVQLAAILVMLFVLLI